MRYKYYYGVSNGFPEIPQDFLLMLEEEQIRYKTLETDGRITDVFFTVYSDSLDFPPIIGEKINNFPWGKYCRSWWKKTEPHISLEFSKKDLENAKYLEIRSSRPGFRIINPKEIFEYSCFSPNAFDIMLPWHEKQIGPLIISKEPAALKPQTAIFDTDGSELLADIRIRDLAKENDLKGICFEPVKLKNGEYSKKIYQITSEHTLDRSCLELGHGEKKFVCPVCGKENFFIADIMQVHLKLAQIESKCDFYVTESMFGEGRMPGPRYIISQKFYQLLKLNKLAGGLCFRPIIDVS